MATLENIKKQLQGFAKKNPNSRAQELLDYMNNGHTEFRETVNKQRNNNPIPNDLQGEIIRNLNAGTIGCVSDMPQTAQTFYKKVFSGLFGRDKLPIIYKIDPNFNMLWVTTTEQQLDGVYNGDYPIYGSGKSAIRKFKKAHLQQAKEKYGFNDNQVLFLGV